MGQVITFPTPASRFETEWPMAVGAENFVPHILAGDYQPDFLDDALEVAAEFNAINADDDPFLREVRVRARGEAEEILRGRRKDLFAGDFESVPLDVDALGTSAKVAAVAREFGVNSPEHREAREGLVLDYERKVAEAFRNNAWEYFAETTQAYQPETDELFAHGFSVDGFLRNGITPVIEENEEIERRMNDFVGSATNKAVLNQPDANEVATLRVSPCPDWAVDMYKKDPKKSFRGYAPAIEKVMIYFDTFNPESLELGHVQIGVSGLHITPEVIQEALVILGAVSGDSAQLSRSEIQNTVAKVKLEKLGSGLDFLRLLDQLASEKSGKNIYIGEEVPADHPKDYSLIPEEAKSRQQKQEALSLELVAYVEDLESRGVDRNVATMMVERYLQRKLLEVAKNDPDQAEIIFNKATADGFRKVKDLELEGRLREARMLQQRIEKEAPPAGSCGPNSCDLEGVDRESEEGKKLAEELRVEEEKDMTIVKDKARSCTSCGKKSVVYAYNKTKVNKYCRSCKAFESKITK